MADKKANQGTKITPEARVANNIVRVSNEDGTAGNGLKIPLTDFSLRDIQTTRNACIALLETGGATGADITTGQGYVFDGLDGTIPTDTSMIRIVGIPNLTGKGFSLKAQALVTKLSKWFDCDYNVVTGEISGDYLLWAGYLTQTGSSDPTVDSTVMNNLPEVPTFTYQGFTGKYWMVTATSLFDATKIVSIHTPIPNGDDFASPYAYLIFGDSNNKTGFFTGQVALDYFDGLLNNTYIEFRQRF